MGSESAAWEHHLDDRAGASLTGSASSLYLLLLLLLQQTTQLFLPSFHLITPHAQHIKSDLSNCKLVTL